VSGATNRTNRFVSSGFVVTILMFQSPAWFNGSRIWYVPVAELVT